jgi:hypothetical protein
MKGDPAIPKRGSLPRPALALPGPWTESFNLEYVQAGGNFRSPLGGSIKTGREDAVTTDAASRLFDDQVLYEAGARHDRCAEVGL